MDLRINKVLTSGKTQPGDKIVASMLIIQKDAQPDTHPIKHRTERL